MTDPGNDPEGGERKQEKSIFPAPVRRLGVLGTMVWDRVFFPGEDVPRESWGGLSYALEAFCAALPENWVVVPIVKVGRDRVGNAREYLAGLGRVGDLSGVLEVPLDAVTVERRYLEGWKREERLLGTELPWTKGELGLLRPGLDALYLNFITGFEMTLETALSLKADFPPPLYADLHSLFLAKDEDGRRSIRELPHWRDWVRAFDVVQMNEEEFGTLAGCPEDSRAEAGKVLGRGVSLMAVTLGAEGAEYLGPAAPEFDTGGWLNFRTANLGAGGTPASGTLRRRVSLKKGSISGDPSGCGDVWGATFFSRLLAGARLEAAVADANLFASRKVGQKGAPGLRHHLQG